MDGYHTGKLRSMASLYLLQSDRILLLLRQGESIVSNLWIGSAGGHFEAQEFCDAKACVLRELQEELGLISSQTEGLTLRYVTLRYMDGEIRQNYYFFAKLRSDTPLSLSSTEGIIQWFPFDQLQDLPMPYTARFVIDHYLCQGQYDDHLYGGIANDIGLSFITL